MNEQELKMFDIDAQLDAAFGKEGTPDRRAAEGRANAFFTGQINGGAKKKNVMTQVEEGRTEPKISLSKVSALELNIELIPIE